MLTIRKATLADLGAITGIYNEAILHLSESIGCRHIGVMKECGRKFGRLLDIYLMQYIYE